MSAARSTKDVFLGVEVRGYVFRERIGEGGMGIVYRADQPALGRSVAIKVLHAHLGTEPRTLARFDLEARAASQLNHPNAVSILDFGLMPGDGRPYLVMEYLRGRDLGQILDSEILVPLPRVERIVLDILSVLSEAHQLGFVHRDLKPENVMLVQYRDGVERAKVLDFGLAKLYQAEVRPVTLPGVVVGTPGYMAPEAISGDAVDGRTDLYSLGVILFQLLTSRLPFEARTIPAMLLAHLTRAPPDPATLAPRGRVTRWLADITLRALAKAPEDRFESAEQMRAEVQAAFADVLTASRRLDVTLPGIPAVAGEPASVEEELARLEAPELDLLRAAAVLGCRAPIDAIGAIVGGADPAALEPLVAAGMVESMRRGFVELDTNVQRLVYASIPAAERSSIHDRALAWLAIRGEPVESRLHHALRGSEPLVALLVLERVVDQSLEIGNLERAIDLCRRAFDISRRELVVGGDDVFERAYTTFAQKLASALMGARRPKEAEGVLVEALELTPPTSGHRPTLVAALRDVRATVA